MRAALRPVPPARLARPERPSIHGTSVIPRRALLATAGTVLGLALLLSFKTPGDIPLKTGSRLADTAVASPAASTPPGGGTSAGIAAGGGAAGSTAAPTTTPAPTGTTTAGGAAPRRATPAPAATVSPTTVPTAAPTAPAQKGIAASGDVTGPVEDTPFGSVQVQVKVQSGRIVDIVALQLPNDRRRSAQISQYVAPILHDEALAAQSSQIDLISGATWTSGAYQASLQGALDKLANG
jgi:uncharacterized protein with FMN-binding domain